MAIVMEGKALAAKIKEEVRLRVEGMVQKPGLAVVLVGEAVGHKRYERSRLYAADFSTGFRRGRLDGGV